MLPAPSGVDCALRLAVDRSPPPTPAGRCPPTAADGPSPRPRRTAAAKLPRYGFYSPERHWGQWLSSGAGLEVGKKGPKVQES